MTKQCVWLSVFAVAFTLILGSDLLAAQPKGKAKQTVEQKYKALDKDNDGKLTPQEFIGLKEGEAKDKAMKQFLKLDKNHDGHLSLEEYKATTAKKAPKKAKK